MEGAATLAPRGCEYSLFVDGPADLNRQVLKGEHASLEIASLQVQVPAQGGRSYLNTIEGLLRGFADDLESAALDASQSAQEAEREAQKTQSASQNVGTSEAAAEALREHFFRRQSEALERASRLREVVGRLRAMASGEERSFWIDLRDPSGGSSIESEESVLEKMQSTRSPEPSAPAKCAERVFPPGTKRLDSRLFCKFFERSAEELRAMGFMTPSEKDAEGEAPPPAQDAGDSFAA